jgi:hypothetical protein
MAAGFPLKTTFADGNVLPASDLNDISNTLQLTGTYPDQLAPLAADAVRRPLPFATVCGQVSDSRTLAAATVATVAVSVPAIYTTRFTVSPIITVAKANLATNANPITVWVSSVTTAGFNINFYNPTAASITYSGLAVNYIAVQTTSASASG